MRLKYSKMDTPVKITVTTTTKNGRPILIVKDNGIGIDLKRFGDRVFNLNQTFHRGYESKGVGLYITRSQVESLGGTIQVKSTVNEGSEFIVEFYSAG